MALTTTIPYEDYKALVQDQSDKNNVIAILQTEFPDDTCALIAVKAILGIVENEPEDPDPGSGTTDPTDPPTDPSTP